MRSERDKINKEKKEREKIYIYDSSKALKYEENQS